MLKISLFLFLYVSLFADISVVKSVTLQKMDYLNMSTKQLKQKILKKAKLEASQEIYGEFLSSNTVMKDGDILDDVVHLNSGGIIHLKGKALFFEDKKKLMVTIEAYATDKDLDKSYSIISDALQKQQIKKQPKRDTFLGLWSGFLLNDDGFSSSVEISIENFAQPIINYKSQKCAGELIVQEKSSKKVIFKEILTFLKGECINNTFITLRVINQTSLEFTQNKDGENLFSGRLYLVK